MTWRRRVVSFGMAIAFCLTWAATSGAQSFAEDSKVSYAPKMGQIYDYGIEFRLSKNVFVSVGRPISVHQRCRLRYEVTEVTQDGWIARYKTIPFLGSSLAKDNDQIRKDHADKSASEKRLVERSASLSRRVQVPSSLKLPPLPNAPRGPAEDIFTSSVKKEGRRRELQLKEYPGLFLCCEGTIRCSGNRSVVVESGDGALPFGIGHIAGMIFVDLPNDRNIDAGFSSKRVSAARLFNMRTNQNGSSAGRTGVEAKLSVLSVFSPDLGASQNVVAFDRKFECTNDANLVMAGKGSWTHAPKLSMPYSGNLAFKTDGASYCEDQESFDVKIDFQYLNQVGASLFDISLSPNPDALEREKMPRIDAEQQRALIKRLAAVRSKKSTFPLEIFTKHAPVPVTSKLYREIKKLVAAGKIRDKHYQESVQKIKTGRGSLGAILARPSGYGKSAAAVVEHYDKLRRIATILPRVWSDADGKFKIHAKLVGLSGENVILRRIDNDQTITVPLARLSERDSEFASTFGVLAKQ